MPWDATTFASRHNKKLKGRAAEIAAHVANKKLEEGKDEGSAIRIGNAVGNRIQGKANGSIYDRLRGK